MWFTTLYLLSFHVISSYSRSSTMNLLSYPTTRGLTILSLSCLALTPPGFNNLNCHQLRNTPTMWYKNKMEYEATARMKAKPSNFVLTALCCTMRSLLTPWFLTQSQQWSTCGFLWLCLQPSFLWNSSMDHMNYLQTKNTNVVTYMSPFTFYPCDRQIVSTGNE